jgi:hypothetical protein
VVRFRQSACSRRVTWALTLSLAVLACSVDHRKLNQDTPSGAHSPPSDGGRAGSSNVNVGGDDSSPSVAPPLVDGCADLDTDGVADCSVTLVKNAGFESDTDGWTTVDGSPLVWDGENALSDSPSGSALLTAEGSTDIEGSALFRAAQCIPAGAGQLVIAYANAWVAGAEEADAAAHAELRVSYFDAEACTGDATGYFVTPPNAATDAWVTVQAGGVTGPATASILVELTGVKPYRTAKLRAYFDNIMVKLQPL